MRRSPVIIPFFNTPLWVSAIPILLIAWLAQTVWTYFLYVAHLRDRTTIKYLRQRILDLGHHEVSETKLGRKVAAEVVRQMGQPALPPEHVLLLLDAVEVAKNDLRRAVITAEVAVKDALHQVSEIERALRSYQKNFMGIIEGPVDETPLPPTSLPQVEAVPMEAPASEPKPEGT
jgi:hypothetical protein